MDSMTRYLGRGLLVLALCGMAACGDDDTSTDAGTDSGVSGTGGGGTGGSGGSGGTDGGTGGTDGGMTVTKQECIDMTTTNTGGMVSDTCINCACENGATEIAACDSTCWALIDCYSRNCPGVDPSDTAAAGACISNHCASSIGGIATSGPAGMVLTGSCSTECPPPAATDGGTTEDGGT